MEKLEVVETNLFEIQLNFATYQNRLLTKEVSRCFSDWFERIQEKRIPVEYVHAENSVIVLESLRLIGDGTDIKEDFLLDSVLKNKTKIKSYYFKFKEEVAKQTELNILTREALKLQQQNADTKLSNKTRRAEIFSEDSDQEENNAKRLKHANISMKVSDSNITSNNQKAEYAYHDQEEGEEHAQREDVFDDSLMDSDLPANRISVSVSVSKPPPPSNEQGIDQKPPKINALEHIMNIQRLNSTKSKQLKLSVNGKTKELHEVIKDQVTHQIQHADCRGVMSRLCKNLEIYEKPSILLITAERQGLTFDKMQKDIYLAYDNLYASKSEIVELLEAIKKEHYVNFDSVTKKLGKSNNKRRGKREENNNEDNNEDENDLWVKLNEEDDYDEKTSLTLIQYALNTSKDNNLK